MMQFVQEFTKVICCADRATQNGQAPERKMAPKQFALHGTDDDKIVQQEKVMQESLSSGFPSSPCSQREPAPEPTPVPSLTASESPSATLASGLVMGSSPNSPGLDDHGFEDESPTLSVQLNIVAPTNEKIEHPILENKKSIARAKEEKDAKDAKANGEKEKMNDVVKAAVQAAAPPASTQISTAPKVPESIETDVPFVSETQVIMSPSNGAMIAATGSVGMQMLVL
mmetsp:Transcript_84289/g.184977  ORF Transcript_84289/g.184977 Transcript_84289/m.184977 type:complete len:227 (-) Transcript_84289:319-999(-)|eukprot:CAMPEP_0206532330 /NCGR_PEP_ID=MMETSP0325_2-20121206/4307_1 /ASSEMBLY_ACC=CAM_ASM_000347 /TAXON_ID=2866 /ORGANISM="Crypthecodinium cohnii, Strain Seligo" /LENGTH=226 /DNA_ID=CAMNT_0054028765 /DNA_START=60 /DNA_END=740 /DNA_ORIENTATION=+